MKTTIISLKKAGSYFGANCLQKNMKTTTNTPKKRRLHWIWLPMDGKKNLKGNGNYVGDGHVHSRDFYPGDPPFPELSVCEPYFKLGWSVHWYYEEI